MLSARLRYSRLSGLGLGALLVGCGGTTATEPDQVQPVLTALQIDTTLFRSESRIGVTVLLAEGVSIPAGSRIRLDVITDEGDREAFLVPQDRAGILLETGVPVSAIEARLPAIGFLSTGPIEPQGGNLPPVDPATSRIVLGGILTGRLPAEKAMDIAGQWPETVAAAVDANLMPGVVGPDGPGSTSGQIEAMFPVSNVSGAGDYHVRVSGVARIRVEYRQPDGSVLSESVVIQR